MTSQIISHIIGTVIGVIVVLSIELIIKVIDDSYWSTMIRERVSRDMAEIDAEEREREAERRSIPEPEKPADVTVGEVKSRLYCYDNRCIIKKEGFALFCKGKIVKMYPTKTEAEAARLQFIRDYNIKDKEENYEL